MVQNSRGVDMFQLRLSVMNSTKPKGKKDLLVHELKSWGNWLQVPLDQTISAGLCFSISVSWIHFMLYFPHSHFLRF